MPNSEDIPENKPYEDDNEMEDLIAAESEHASSSFQLCGILWLTSNTSFDCFPLVSFNDSEIASNLTKVCKIFEDVQLKFASKYLEIFSETVMNNWKSWLKVEQQRWSPTCKRNTHAQLLIPSSYHDRLESDNVCIPNVIDSAPPDIDDGIEYVAHNSGVYGCLTTEQQREALATRGSHILQSLGSGDHCEVILENMACIYKFTYPHLQSKTDIEQIGVGIIDKAINPDTPNSRLSIRLCPLTGAKPKLHRA